MGRNTGHVLLYCVYVLICNNKSHIIYNYNAPLKSVEGEKYIPLTLLFFKELLISFKKRQLLRFKVTPWLAEQGHL